MKEHYELSHYCVEQPLSINITIQGESQYLDVAPPFVIIPQDETIGSFDVLSNIDWMIIPNSNDYLITDISPPDGIIYHGERTISITTNGINNTGINRTSEIQLVDVNNLFDTIKVTVNQPAVSTDT